MTPKIALENHKILYSPGETLELELKILDPAIMGRQVDIEIHRQIKVRVPGGHSKIIMQFRKFFDIQQSTHTIRIPPHNMALYTYRGKAIELTVYVHAVVDDSIFFDTTLSIPIAIDFKKKWFQNDASDLIKPQDRLAFFDNLFAIPTANRLRIVAMLALALLLVGTSGFVAFHDRYAMEPNDIIIYDFHYASDFKIAVVANLVFFILLAIVMHILIRKQLRGYLKLSTTRQTKKIIRGRRYRLNDFIHAKTTGPVKNLRVRIVAANIEKGQYCRGNSTRRTTTFRTPVRAVVIYDKPLPDISGPMALDDYLNEPFDFDEMFDLLYPHFTFSKMYGLELTWRIQFLHDQYINREIKCSHQLFQFDSFLIPPEG